MINCLMVIAIAFAAVPMDRAHNAEVEENQPAATEHLENLLQAEEEVKVPKVDGAKIPLIISAFENNLPQVQVFKKPA